MMEPVVRHDVGGICVDHKAAFFPLKFPSPRFRSIWGLALYAWFFSVSFGFQNAARAQTSTHAAAAAPGAILSLTYIIPPLTKCSRTASNAPVNPVCTLFNILSANIATKFHGIAVTSHLKSRISCPSRMLKAFKGI